MTSFILQGTAVYAYAILANTLTFTALTNLTFMLDGALVGSFVHVPSNSGFYQYGFPIYANSSLTNEQHTFRIEAAGGPNGSLILFDNLLYT